MFYQAHPRALALVYADLEGHALAQAEAFPGTAGSLVARSNADGFGFFAHQYYDADGKQRERYVAGPIGSEAAEASAAELRARITEVRALVPSLRLLGREGFSLVDPRTYATIAGLHNAGLFAAGATLVGSHAYGVVLNKLGVRAAAYTTEDVDLARGRALSFERPLPDGLLGLLRGSGIEFVAVPSLDRKRPSTSFKQRGRSTFHLDLLVPSRDETFPIVPVPELQAHGVGLPYLGWLLEESQMAAALARAGCCAVRVPLPERFAVHKLIVSQLRTGRDAKSAKDLHQACVLCAALAESHPGAIEEAVARVPRRARRHLARALRAALPLLDEYPRAREELGC